MDFIINFYWWFTIIYFVSIPFIWIWVFCHKIKCRRKKECSNRKCMYWQFCEHNYMERMKDELELRNYTRNVKEEVLPSEGYLTENETSDGSKEIRKVGEYYGGTVIETESERLMRVGADQGAARMIVELGQEDGLDDALIMKRMQEKVGLSLEQAKVYLKQYGK